MDPYSFLSLEEMEAFFEDQVSSPEVPLDGASEYVYRVDELVDALNAVLRYRIGPLSIRGEISGGGRQRSKNGHRYFRLKEGKHAVMDAVMFASAARRISCPVEEGIEVQCRGRLAMYGPQGRIQFVVEQMERLGVGDLMLAYQQLKDLLEAEGLFDPFRKKPIPQFPKKIGVVTSPTGAAVRDILHVLKRRAPSVSVLFAPSQVQGRGAAGQIVRALRNLEQQSDVDVIILGRGGGSIEDLWAFNEEQVARAVAAAEIPIISGVGHETDFTIVDFVSDLRAPTPSAAAEMAVLEEEALRAALRESLIHLQQQMQHWLSHQRMSLKNHRKSLPRLDHRIRVAQQQMSTLQERLIIAWNRILERHRYQLHTWMQRLNDLSPLQILQRGFALVHQKDGRIVGKAGMLSEGQEVDVRFVDDRVTMKVVKKRGLE